MRKLMIKKLGLGAVIICCGIGIYSYTHSDSSTDIPNFKAIKDTHQKKKAFFDYMRPKFTVENERIIKERALLSKINVKSVTGSQKSTAEELAKEYSLPLKDEKITQAWLNEMLSRVNVLPEALVLTQAANESAWGTSRFALHAHNFFGQWCYTEGCGLVPQHRQAGKTHEVAKFSSTQMSVHRYFMNVNRNHAYQDLRKIRQQLASKKQDLTSKASAIALTNGLLAYSERGADYVHDLQAMIHHNDAYWSH